VAGCGETRRGEAERQVGGSAETRAQGGAIGNQRGPSVGREHGHMRVTELARQMGSDPSNVSRGYERARHRRQTGAEFRRLVRRSLSPGSKRPHP